MAAWWAKCWPRRGTARHCSNRCRVHQGTWEQKIRYAVTHEGARHLDDVLSRRTRVAMETADSGLACAAEVARLLAALLDWDAAREAAELEDYRRQVTLVKKAAGEAESDEEAAQMASITPSLLPFPTVHDR